MSLFKDFCQVRRIKSLHQAFIDIFVKGHQHTSQTISAILKVLDSRMFGSKSFDAILNALLK